MQGGEGDADHNGWCNLFRPTHYPLCRTHTYHNWRGLGGVVPASTGVVWWTARCWRVGLGGCRSGADRGHYPYPL